MNEQLGPSFGKQPPAAEKKKGCGCFLWGLVILLVVIVGGSIATFFVAKSYLNSAIDQFTQEQPANLPRTQIDEDSYAALLQRIEDFQNGSGDRIELSAEEITVLVNESVKEFMYELGASRDDDLPPASYVTIEGSEVKAELSLPLKYFPLPFIGKIDRYLNGRGSFEISLIDKRLDVRLRSLHIGDASLPDEAMSQILDQNLAEEFHKQEESKKFFQAVKSIEVRNGKVIISKN